VHILVNNWSVNLAAGHYAMKTPVLREVHVRMGARMGEFAGWELPIDYGSSVAEVRAVREAVGVFDVSHMGRLTIVGNNAAEGLQSLLTNDISVLEDGGGQYTLMTNDRGGVVDDLIVFRRSADEFQLVVNASNHDKDIAWLRDRMPKDVRIEDRTLHTVLFAVQGSSAKDVLADAGFENPYSLRRFHIADGTINRISVSVSRTGYTGEDGFEIECRKDDAEALWDIIMSVGSRFGIKPCGLAARDVLRTEAGLPLYGHEIDENISPVEAGLMRWVKLSKGEFCGRAAIATAAQSGTARRIMGIRMEGRFVPRSGDVVKCAEGDGKVTSGTFSPTLGCGIAMAFLPAESKIGSEVSVDIRGTERLGLIVELPFYSRKNKPLEGNQNVS